MADTADVTKKLARESTFQSQLAVLNDIKTALGTFNSHMDAWAGALSDLTTGDKASLVGAINSVLATYNAHAADSAKHDVFAILDSVSTAATGAFIHNSLARGISLGSSPSADQYARIIDRTFKGLWLGDYWSKQISFSYKDANDDDANKTATITPVMRIADHDYYKRAGDNVDFQTGHLDIVPDSSLFSAPMNKGQNITTGAYAGSDMRTKYLEGALNAFKAFFGDSHVLSYRDYLQNAVTNGKASGGAWYDCRVELMDERQVYGGLVFDGGSPDGSEVPNRHTVATKQFALFRFAPSLVSNRQWFWLRNVVSAASFAYVNSDGSAAYPSASSVAGVRPAALIG